MQSGQQVAGRFTIEALAGAGGMGSVYRARDHETGALVAIKMLHEATGDRARFEREAQALADLRHPAIVRHVAHGYSDAGEPYLAMEWLAGEDLAARLARSRCSVAEALAIARRAAEGLAEIHARGMVHRDLKPSNLFLVGGRIDQLKLIDLGLVRGLRSRLTLTGALLGTPGYIAPEQAQGAVEVGPAADVFSLGCVLFEALAGRPAFQGDHALALLVKLILDDPPNLLDVCPDVSSELALLLRRMLAKRPEDRVPDAAAVLRGLSDLRLAAASDRTSADVSAPRKLTGSERRVLSLILIPALSAGDETLDLTASGTLDASASPLVAHLKAAAEAVNGVFNCLADGSMVLTIGGMEAAKDRAVVAARFALSLRSLVDDRPIVLTTGGAEGGASGIGDSIERAMRRLAGLRRAPATPPPIAIDEVTAALLAARFDCHAAPDGLELRGERGPTEAGRVLLGRRIPCIGRERELQTLAATLRGVIEDSQPHGVLLVAPAGVGKSRLTDEFVHSFCASGVDLWSAQGDPFRTDSSLALLGDAVRGAVGIRSGEPLHERHARLTAAVDAVVAEAERQSVREFLGEIVGAPFPDEHSPQLRAARVDAAYMADRLQHALDSFLAARCRHAPVVLVLEDLHWGDALSVRMLDGALRADDQPLFVLALARPELFDRFPALWSGRRLQLTRLMPLARRAAERLVRAALGPETPADVCARLTERADGNAFYLEELIRATADGQLSVPETVVAMAQSRVEGLEPPLRRMLRAASVFGRVFWASGVQALLGGEVGDRSTEDLLARLVEGELVTRRRTSRFVGEDELEFRHALLREAAYAMLTAEDRGLGHQLAAAWLEQRAEPDARVLAEHCERGGLLVRAVDYYVLAADDSWNSGDAETAAACAGRGLELGAVGQARGDLLTIVAAVHSRNGEVAASLVASEEAIQLLDTGGRQWVRAFHILLPALWMVDPGRLADRFRLFYDVDVGPKLRVEKVFVAMWVDALLTVLGMTDQSRELLAEMQRLLAQDPTDLLIRAAVSAVEAVHNHHIDGRPWQLVIASRAASEGFAAAGLHHYQCICGNIHGKALMEVGDHALAATVQRDVLALAEATRDPVSLAYARLYLARLLVEVGSDAEQDEALALASAAIPSTAAISGQASTVRAECLLRRGELVAAEADARVGSEATRPLPAYWWRSVTVHARILLALDRGAEAVAITDVAVERLLAIGTACADDLELLHAAAEAHHRAGDDERGTALLHGALARLRHRLEDVPDEHRSRFLGVVTAHAHLLRTARARLGPSALADLDLTR